MEVQSKGLTRRHLLKTALGAVGSLTLARKVWAQSPDAVKLGVILPLSGVYASHGEEITRGMTLYLEQVGYEAAGRPIHVIFEDETQDPSTAARKARKLVEADRVDLITGLVSSPSVFAIRDFIIETKTILVIANASSNAFTRELKSPYIFRTSYTTWQQHYPFGPWVARHIARRIVVVTADYTAGWESSDAFKESFIASGGQVVDEIFTPLGSTDFSPYMTSIMRARPDALFAFLVGSDGVIFLRQFAQFGLYGRIPLTVTGGMVQEDALRAVQDVAEGAYSAQVWAPTLDLPANRAFVAAYRQRFGMTPSTGSVLGYDAARFIIEGIRAVDGDTRDKDRLIQAFEAVRFSSPRGEFELDPRTHNMIQNLYVRQVRRHEGSVTNVVLEDLGRFADPGH